MIPQQYEGLNKTQTGNTTNRHTNTKEGNLTGTTPKQISQSSIPTGN